MSSKRVGLATLALSIVTLAVGGAAEDALAPLDAWPRLR